MKMIAIKDSKERGNSIKGVFWASVLLLIVFPAYLWVDDYVKKAELEEELALSQAIIKTNTMSHEPRLAYSCYLENDAFKTYYEITSEERLEVRVDFSRIDSDYISTLVEVYNETNTDAQITVDEVSQTLRTLDPSCEEYKSSTPESRRVASDMLSQLESWLIDERRLNLYDLKTGEKLLPNEQELEGYCVFPSKNGTTVMQRYFDYRYGLADDNIRSARAKGGQ